MCRTTNLLLLLISTSIFPLFTNGALQSKHQHAHDSGCIPAERAALLSFKKGVTSNNTNILASWQGQDCCRWRGVSCDNRTGHVIKLHLGNTNGYYVPCHDANALFGEISPSLLSLKHLEHLDLSMNCLLGTNSKLPHLLGSMGNLRYLNLSGIPFTGTVPSQLGNLSKLQYLDLGQYGNSWIYSTDITWLTKLPFLRFLSMSGVMLSGIPDWTHTLNMIPPLRVIDLSSCSLDSANQSLPHLNLTKLEKLDLSNNYLKNSLGSGWFWKATSLKYLNLRGNRLFGHFPDTLGNMTYLEVLDISFNDNPDMMMTGNMGNLCSLEILDLSINNINGDIAVLMNSWPQCAWKKLQELDLSDNNFIGILPNLTGNFTSLSMLDLSDNSLNGYIPPEIGSLTTLMSLDLSHNNFSGTLVPEIGALTNLAYLNIRNNFFSGSVPSEIGTLTNLVSLDLANNNFYGSVPAEIGALTHLTFLNLSNNGLSGSIPTEISYLSSLISLDLSNNNFSGMVIEEHFTGLKNLKNIDLSFNSLKVVVGSGWLPPFSLESAMLASSKMGPLFPAWLQWQPEITKLDISSTALKGGIPDWFWSTFSQATYLDISNNQLCGSLPAYLDDMAVEKLFLSSNQFTGPVPLLPTNITELDISNNSFSGKLPSNIGVTQLEMFLMYSNQIDGPIPESMCKLQMLVYLDLSNNILEGEIPQCFDVEEMQFLLLSNNSLSGKFPAFLQNSTRLKFLDIAWNKFSGRLPAWIGELWNLHFLLLSHNALSGTIPVEISNLEYLQFLDLSSNKFSGGIPWHLSNLSFMKHLQQDFMPIFDTEVNPAYTGGRRIPIIGAGHLGEILSVITKGQQLIYGSTIAYFVGIDLSSNSLTGEIPTDITSLVALINLNLSSNQLSGQIPNKIGDVQSLVSLDLSQNKLSGQIPSSLSSLTSLSYLNLSYNSLSGRIPSGPQLDILNLDNQSLIYIGNSGLCGPPVHKNCPGNDPSIHGDLESSKEEFDPLTFYFGLGLGFGVGLWMVFCALLFKKTWRIAYFRLFDNVYDQVYVFVVVKWARFAKKADEE